jgi:mono/diheme cytochrome c family protein
VKCLSAAAFAVGLVACQPAAQGGEIATASPPADAAIEASIGEIAFVEAACGGCHATRPLELSPNPDAPSFSDIANRTGLTSATLSAFLRDAHNYPEAMDFDLTPVRVDALAAYIMTLRDESYRPPQ